MEGSKCALAESRISGVYMGTLNDENASADLASGAYCAVVIITLLDLPLELPRILLLGHVRETHCSQILRSGSADVSYFQQRRWKSADSCSQAKPSRAGFPANPQSKLTALMLSVRWHAYVS